MFLKCASLPLAWVCFLVCPTASVLAQQSPIDNAYYIYKDGGNPRRSGPWGYAIPKLAAEFQAISAKPYTIAGRSGAEGDTCVKLRYGFDRINKISNNAFTDMTMVILTDVDCWGDFSPCLSLDLSEYSRLVVWVRGEKGGEQVRFLVSITAGQGPYADSASQQLSYPPANWITLSTAWQQIEIPINGSDMRRVITPFAVTAKARPYAPREPVEIYVDDIYYDHNSR